MHLALNRFAIKTVRIWGDMCNILGDNGLEKEYEYSRFLIVKIWWEISEFDTWG